MSLDETIVGFGYRSPFTIDAPFERVWAAMVDKVYNTSKYLPVINVKTEDHPTYVYREMTIVSPSEKEKFDEGQVYKQKIYLDKENAQIRFETIDKDEIHVNKFHKDENILEYYIVNSRGERENWTAPRSYVHRAMLATRDEALADRSSK